MLCRLASIAFDPHWNIEPDDVVRRVQTVTAADVQAVARELFRAHRLRLAVIGPMKDAKGIERELKQL